MRARAAFFLGTAAADRASRLPPRSDPPLAPRHQHAPLDSRPGGGFCQHRAFRRRGRVRQGDRRGRRQDARGRRRAEQVSLRHRHARRREKVQALPAARQASDAHAELRSARRSSARLRPETRVRARAASGHMPSGQDAVRARRAARSKFRARRGFGRRRRRHVRRQRSVAALAALRFTDRSFPPELRRFPHEHDRDARQTRAQQIRAGDCAVRGAHVTRDRRERERETPRRALASAPVLRQHARGEHALVPIPRVRARAVLHAAQGGLHRGHARAAHAPDRARGGARGAGGGRRRFYKRRKKKKKSRRCHSRRAPSFRRVRARRVARSRRARRPRVRAHRRARLAPGGRGEPQVLVRGVAHLGGGLGRAGAEQRSAGRRR